MKAPRTYPRIRPYYYWKGMRHEVQEWCGSVRLAHSMHVEAFEMLWGMCELRPSHLGWMP